jgi:beta-lactamase regulating signal transducer with metallopeptidase domain
MMTAALNLQSVAQLSAGRILNCTVEGMVIALLAWLVLRAFGPQNSNTRFAVWFAALLGIATLPLFGNWASSGAGMAQRSEITMPGSWALYIFAAWGLMAAAGLLRVGLGFWHLGRLRKSCVLVDVATLDPALRKTLEEFDSPRSVTLCVSDRLRVPTAIGFTKPLVAIPSWTMRELSAAELNTILLHELAHLRRRDDWTNLVQKILGALLFFHPAVWWIEKKLALEREMACDDLVLASTTSPQAYAECLVSLAEKSFLRRGLALAQAAVDRLRNVSLRVSQILDVDRPTATRVWRPAPVLVGGVSLVCLLALSHAPTRLVSFGNASVSPAVANVIAPRDFEASQISDLSPSRIMGAQVIPARLQLGPEPVGSERGRAQKQASTPMVATRGVGKSFRRANLPDIIPANALQHRVKPPMLIRSSMADDGVTPQTWFVVMRAEFLQTRQYGASGPVVWDLCVWQVTVIGPGQNMTAGQIIAKSI